MDDRDRELAILEMMGKLTEAINRNVNNINSILDILKKAGQSIDILHYRLERLEKMFTVEEKKEQKKVLH